jgi:hypothetical protein
VIFAAITLCVASRVFIVVSIYVLMTQSGYFWIHRRIRHVQEALVLLRNNLVKWLFYRKDTR